MGEVERLLTAALVQIAPIDPAHTTAQHSLREDVAGHWFEKRLVPVPGRSVS
jgi:hypothetical protein